MYAVPVFLLVEPSSFVRSIMREWLGNALTDFRILIAVAVIMDWRFTTDDARIKLKKLYPTIRLIENVNEPRLVKP